MQDSVTEDTENKAFWVLRFTLVLQRELIEAKAEGGSHGQEVVEDVGLYGFIFGPDLIAEEKVDFDWHSELSWFALSND